MMVYIVVGLGSMGKRRIRNLLSVDQNFEIYGVDFRSDRRQECEELHGIKTFETISQAVKIDGQMAFFVSTPPDKHLEPIREALHYNADCFVEASVMGQDELMRLGIEFHKKNLLLAPSATYKYYPGPQRIRKFLDEGTIGNPIYYNYQVGQYLPNWHPWESVHDFYVSKRETGACREIVPFELTWLTEIFGNATPISGFRTNLGNKELDIDDIYQINLAHENGTIGSLTIEVISQPGATRLMTLLGSKGKIVFDGFKNSISVDSTNLHTTIHEDLGEGTVMTGYINPEEPYVKEIQIFLSAIKSRNFDEYPNSVTKDVLILNTLEAIEKCIVQL
jgi:predicted dehydrogenase